jgi:hypothetical protein
MAGLLRFIPFLKRFGEEVENSSGVCPGGDRAGHVNAEVKSTVVGPLGRRGWRGGHIWFPAWQMP